MTCKLDSTGKLTATLRGGANSSVVSPSVIDTTNPCLTCPQPAHHWLHRVGQGDGAKPIEGGPCDSHARAQSPSSRRRGVPRQKGLTDKGVSRVALDGRFMVVASSLHAPISGARALPCHHIWRSDSERRLCAFRQKSPSEALRSSPGCCCACLLVNLTRLRPGAHLLHVF